MKRHLLPLLLVLAAAAACHGAPGPTGGTRGGRCRIIPLQARRRVKAGTVLVGAVQSLFVRRDPSDGLVAFAAKVRVGGVLRDASGGLRPGDLVVVGGLANPKICASRPRIGDRRIFFATPLPSSSSSVAVAGPATVTVMRHLRLRSSLLRPTERNLAALEALLARSPAPVNITASGSVSKGKKEELRKIRKKSLFSICGH